MQLKVKLLKGGWETAIEVENGSLGVLELKRKLADVLEIPVGEQSLIYRGKALLDTQDLDSYGIKDGAKLFLSRKPHTRGASPASGVTGDSRAPCDPEPMETGGEERVVLTVRLLKSGREEVIEVENDQVTVQEVKKTLERRCNIPSHQQSLVVAGKALADSHRLCDCNIRSGAKLFLAQRTTPTPPPPPPSQPSIWNHKTTFWDQLQSYLSQHFSQSDSERITRRMEEELRHRVYDVNLDTIEAMAIRTLRKQS